MLQATDYNVRPIKSPHGWPQFSDLPTEKIRRVPTTAEVEDDQVWEAEFGDLWFEVKENRRFRNWEARLFWPGGKWYGYCGDLESVVKAAPYFLRAHLAG